MIPGNASFTIHAMMRAITPGTLPNPGISRQADPRAVEIELN
jgi:hypothetical protein